jgi:hypothetical protein
MSPLLWVGHVARPCSAMRPTSADKKIGVRRLWSCVRQWHSEPGTCRPSSERQNEMERGWRHSENAATGKGRNLAHPLSVKSLGVGLAEPGASKEKVVEQIVLIRRRSK